MVRNLEPWTLGEPECNDHGQPVIHDITQKLGCTGPKSEADLPVHSIFPVDEASMVKLSHQLEEQQTLPQPRQHPQHMSSNAAPHVTTTPGCRHWSPIHQAVSKTIRSIRRCQTTKATLAAI